MTLARYRAAKVTLPSSLPSVPATLMLCALILFAPLARGVELGDITLHSSPNEPLEASIQLLQMNSIDAEGIRVALASRDEFERSGINYSPFLDSLSFSVVTRDPDTGDTGTVTLSSERLLQAAYLDLIVELRWPDGQLLRAYTLPVDSAERADGLSDAVMVAGDYQVGEDETLWHVALRVRQDSRITVQQVMIAIQRENENAFINRNINSLRSDAVLRVPALGREAMPTESVALAEVQRQNRLAGLPINGWVELGELRQLDSEGETLAEAVEGAGSELDEQFATLETQAMASEEVLDRSRLENQESVARLDEVNSQIDLLDNSIDIEAEREAEQQAQPGVESDGSARLAEAVDRHPAIPSSSNARVSERTVGLADREDVVESNDIVPAEPESIAPPSEPVEREDAILTDWLENPVTLLVGAALLIAFVLGLLFLARRRAAAQVVSPGDNVLSASRKPAVANAPIEPAEEVDFDLGGLTFDEDDFDAADDSADYGADYDDEVPIDEDEPLSSRIDLAVAYEAMGDLDSARKMLWQVLETGSDYDQEDARRLLKAWDNEGVAD